MTFLRRSFILLGSTSVILGSAACTVPSEDSLEDAMLMGTVWQLQQIQYNNDTLLTIDSPQNYTIEFAEDGTAVLQADCNQGSADYALTGDSQISISRVATTKAACAPESAGDEFVQRLNDAAIYFFQDGQLFIDLFADAGTMQFAAAPDLSDLTGVVWQLQEIQYNDDTLVTAESPENYTVEFLEDGSVAVQADCNRGMGTFSATADRQITIGPLATTTAACGEESIDVEFLQGLNDSSIYFFQDGNLYLDIKFDAGTMKLSPAAG